MQTDLNTEDIVITLPSSFTVKETKEFVDSFLKNSTSSTKIIILDASKLIQIDSFAVGCLLEIIKSIQKQSRELINLVVLHAGF